MHMAELNEQENKKGIYIFDQKLLKKTTTTTQKQSEKDSQTI